MSRQREHQLRRQARGVCLSCPRPVERFVRCTACRAKWRARARAKREEQER